MRQIGHDGRCAGAGAAAHTGGDEHHVGSLQRLGNQGSGFLGGFLADIGLGACAHAAGQLLANLNFILADRFVEILLIGVDNDEIHAAHTGFNHSINNIVAGTADTNHFNFHDAIL